MAKWWSQLYEQTPVAPSSEFFAALHQVVRVVVPDASGFEFSPLPSSPDDVEVRVRTYDLPVPVRYVVAPELTSKPGALTEIALGIAARVAQERLAVTPKAPSLSYGPKAPSISYPVSYYYKKLTPSLKPSDLYVTWEAPKGLSGGPSHPTLDALAKLCPALLSTSVSCPACPPPMSAAVRLQAMIPHLNDHHKWSREEIAKWLETDPQFANVDLVLNHPSSTGD